MTPEQWYKIIYQKAVSLLEEEKNIYWGEKKQSERIKEQIQLCFSCERRLLLSMAKIMKEIGFVKKEFQVYEEKYNIPLKGGM